MSQHFFVRKPRFAKGLVLALLIGLVWAPTNYSFAQQEIADEESAILVDSEDRENSEITREPASTKSKAESKSVQQPPNGMNIQILDPRIKSDELERAGYNIQRADDVEGFKKVPEPNYRDKLLARVGLTEAVADWDHLDRDMLFMRAKNYEVERLQKFYPKIPNKKLRALKKEIEETGVGK